MNNDARSRGDWQGMNWVRQSTRLAIYLRDGFACAYCGRSVEQGAILTLDHIIPHSKGGSNAPENLVTCCKMCNSSRGTRTVAEFARATANYLGVDAEEITRHIRRIRRRKLPRAEARKLIARRGSVAKVVARRLGE